MTTTTNRMFSEDLWDKFESVVKKVGNGKAFTVSFSKFLVKQQQIESHYAKSIVKLCKDKSFAPEMEMGTLRDSFQCYREQLELIGALHEEFSIKLESIITNGVDQYIEQSRKQRKALIATGEKITKDLKTAESNESRAKLNYEKLKKKQEEANEDLSKQPPGAKEQKARKNVESATKAADKGDTEYKDSVKCLQQNQQKFYHEEMPRILDDLQRFEVDRIDRSKDWLLDIINQNEIIPPAVVIHNENIKKGIESIDRERDLQNYILVTMSGAQKPTECKYEPYQGTSSFSTSFSGSGMVNSGSNGNIANRRSFEPSSSLNISSPNGAGGHLSSPPSTTSTSNLYNNIDQQNPPNPQVVTTPPPSTNNVAVQVVVPPQPPISLNKVNDGGNGNNSNVDIVRALYDYNATEDNEISFKANAMIKVVLRDESGWWKGSVINEDGTEDKVGVFPSNFAQCSTDSTSSTKTIAAGSKCRVLYDYHSDCDGELNIKEGEILTIEYEDEGWYFGSNESGVSARYPSNYVVMI